MINYRLLLLGLRLSPSIAKASSISTQIISVSSNLSTDNEVLDVERIINNNRKRYWVWNHFTHEKQFDSTNKAICNYCKQSLACLGNSGTKHLHHHLAFACKSSTHKNIITPRSWSTYLDTYLDSRSYFLIYFLYLFLFYEYLCDRFALNLESWTRSQS